MMCTPKSRLFFVRICFVKATAQRRFSRSRTEGVLLLCAGFVHTVAIFWCKTLKILPQNAALSQNECCYLVVEPNPPLRFSVVSSSSVRR